MGMCENLATAHQQFAIDAGSHLNVVRKEGQVTDVWVLHRPRGSFIMATYVYRSGSYFDPPDVVDEYQLGAQFAIDAGSRLIVGTKEGVFIDVWNLH